MNLAKLAWPEIAALAPHTPVAVPVAAMEQHGLHLPLATDSMLLGGETPPTITKPPACGTPQSRLPQPLVAAGHATPGRSCASETGNPSPSAAVSVANGSGSSA